MIPLASVLLRLFPAQFRRRYGGEVLDAVKQGRRAAGRGFVSSARYSLYVTIDLLAALARLRLRQLTDLLERAAGGGGVPHLPPTRKRSEMDTVRQDLRYAVRQFVRRPGFTAIAVLSLGLAIGANSAIYGTLDGFVFHPFPYPDPDRLVAVGVTFPKLSSETTYVETISPAEYLDLRAARSFSATASFDLGNRNITGGDVPERVFTALLLDDLFPVIGMPAALGRGFTKEELAPNGAPVAIISHRLWHGRFAGDPDILGKPVRINGRATSIVGVMPPGLVVIGTDLWLPWGGDPQQMPRNARQFNVLARLAPATTLAQANAELEAIARRVERSERPRFAEYENWRLTATPWAAALLRDLRPAAFILLGAAALVLLIACANLTNLFLARASSRQRELAVRLALGAARWRLTRLLLTESVLLAAAGAVVGLLLAWAGLRGATALIPGQFQSLGLDAPLNTRVLLWSLALAMASGVLVGLAPAWQATRTDPQDSLKSDPRSGGGERGQRLRHTLVIAELAVSVALLLGAGLLMQSFLNIQRVNRGFDANGVLTTRLTLPRDRYPGEAAGAFFDDLAVRLRALPGVTAVGAASQFPPNETFETRFTIEGAAADTKTLPTALITVATPSYFEALRIPLRGGRVFAATDRLDSPLVAIVNESFAQRYLPGRDPLGQRITLGSGERAGTPSTIVGVVADYRNAALTDPVRPQIFTPVRQQTAWNQLFVLVRGDVAGASLIPSVRRTVASLDRDQPIYLTRTMDEVLATASFQQRVSAVLVGIFAMVALILAAIGIYGVMSYAVAARTQEIGVRLAVGAQRRDVMWLILRQVLRLSAIGLGVGALIVAAAGPALERLLFGVRAADPAVIAITAVVLAVVALAAAWGPAWRASRIDPIAALRCE
ncbi:MAG TPA: ABC transporter permease [Vicinamibacterales bacterium]|nr:ABC transporter permease [Vicinamibacterales bacterium]